MKTLYVLFSALALFISVCKANAQLKIDSAEPKSASKKTTASANQSPFHWLLTYKGKTANDIIWDKRYKSLLTTLVPQRQAFLLGFSSSLQHIVQEVLGGPPENVVINQDRYVFFSSCRLHSCNEKGFMWVDTKENIGIIGVIHYFEGKKYRDSPLLSLISKYPLKNGSNLPIPFCKSLDQFLEEHKFVNVPTFFIQ
jgi:hypothetical protein